MRRQATTTTFDRSEVFGRFSNAVRLDPYSLPQRFRYDTGIDPRSGRPMGEAAVYLERTMAQVCRRLPSGIPMAMNLPMAAFEGVAVRIVTGDGEGHERVVVELLHRDPQLSLPLSVAADLAEIAADWQAWSRVLGLPMLLVEADGTWRPIEPRLGTIAVARPKPRRRRSVLGKRRPRFLTRRKVGVIDEAAIVIHRGTELFGRD